MRSEQIGELAKALSEAQAVITPPKKARTAEIAGKDSGKHFKYNYADLSDVIECYRQPLSKHGLAVTQTTRIQDGHIVLVTTLMHASGQWIDSDFPIASFARPQEQGSALTYARRYAVCGILGIAAEEDDDGAAAQGGKPSPKAAKPVPAPAPALAGELSNEEIQAVHLAAKKAGLKSTGELAPVLTQILGVSKASEIPKKELANVIEALTQIAERIPA